MFLIATQLFSHLAYLSPLLFSILWHIYDILPIFGCPICSSTSLKCNKMKIWMLQHEFVIPVSFKALWVLGQNQCLH